MKTTVAVKPLSIEKEVFKIESKVSKDLGISKLPDDVDISTMTFVCNMETEFICQNIAKYVDLSYTGIMGVTHGKSGDVKTNRSLLPKKKQLGKKKKTTSVFYNQVSMYVNVSDKKKNPVNVKLFTNGAIQMTGCKTIRNATESLYKIFIELKKIKAIIDNDQIVEKPFVVDIKTLDFKFVKNLRVAMINSNFKIPFKVDRTKLYNLMLSENYDCLYDPVKHACVNIKHEHPDKTISVFVFEKGSIIITGARTCPQILDAYQFINKYLLTNHNAVVKNDNLTNSNITKFFGDNNIIENSDSDDFDLESLIDD